jgi:hypothetical protein
VISVTLKLQNITDKKEEWPTLSMKILVRIRSYEIKDLSMEKIEMLKT